RTKMNQEALLEYVKTVESLQRQVKLRQRNAAKKKAEDLSERDRAILKHGVRAFVEEMLELPEGHKFDPGIAWDDIGIDMLIVDEAAAFKNSYKPEAREHGLPKFRAAAATAASAWQLDFRAAAVRQRTGGSGIVLLTATPAKNSPLEFYNLIQLIDPYAFSSRGLMDPEQFIDRFLRIEPRDHRHDAQGVDAQRRRRLQESRRHAHDHPPLRRVSHRRRGGSDPARAAHRAGPRAAGPRAGGPVRRARRKLERTLQQSQVKGSSQNKILGLLARLSPRRLARKARRGVEYNQALSSVSPADYASPKLTACAERVAASTGCGHVIFCEPTAVHLWMREVLVAHGVPRERIAILNAIETQGADRIRIAREFNGITAEPPAPGSCASGRSQRVPPKYDVIIANSVAYEGIDLQVRSCAVHHLDLTWTPADLEQRNGRVVRQGNELLIVQIYYYLSDRSMDWYRYTLIQGKRGWLGDVLASQARDTSNPGAQQALNDEEILLMISRDPEASSGPSTPAARPCAPRPATRWPARPPTCSSGRRPLPRRPRDHRHRSGPHGCGRGRRAPQGSQAHRRRGLAVGAARRACARGRDDRAVRRIGARVRGAARRSGQARGRPLPRVRPRPARRRRAPDRPARARLPRVGAARRRGAARPRPAAADVEAGAAGRRGRGRAAERTRVPHRWRAARAHGDLRGPRLARRERCVAHPLVAARREAGPRGPRTLDRRAGLPADGRRRTDPRVGPEAARRRAARADPRRLAALPRARAGQRAQVRRAARGRPGVLGPQVPARPARGPGRRRNRGRDGDRGGRRSLFHQP
ncbi:MAG: hypothetical protein IPN16_26825, partial [Gemmatimonadetes bacterium]|nr:hypothetical protein [Gemmatimonadota bacterium]